jgi:hypothetical protein
MPCNAGWPAMNFPDLQSTACGSAGLKKHDAKPLSRLRRFLHKSGCVVWILLSVSVYVIDRDRGLDQLEHSSWTHIEGAPASPGFYQSLAVGDIMHNPTLRAFPDPTLDYEHHEREP